MKKYITVDGKKHTIKTREAYAPLQRVVKDKKAYQRNIEKKKVKDRIEEDLTRL